MRKGQVDAWKGKAPADAGASVLSEQCMPVTLLVLLVQASTLEPCLAFTHASPLTPGSAAPSVHAWSLMPEAQVYWASVDACGRTHAAALVPTGVERFKRGRLNQ